MTITTIQKLINIGSSRGVTLPAKDLKVLKLKDGDFIKITIEPILSEKTLTQEYSEFKKQYGKTLKKLAK